ncbi:MAG: hypothetical protein L6407_06540, partial [Candidatus Delongbacteria bacterium]|nr:hypothetical protein [Candidatus Delongbacteria bacterium]
MKYFFILILLLILSVAFIALRESALKEYTPPKLEFIDVESVNKVNISVADNKRSGIIIFDIANLAGNSISDSLFTPALYKISKKSKIFYSTINLSPDRFTSLKSFIECIPPYKFNDNKEPYKNYKMIISDELRNSSVFNEYAKSGYLTKSYTSDSCLFFNTEKYFLKSNQFKSKERVLEAVYKDLCENINSDFIFYADISDGFKESGNYMKDIDHLIRQFTDRIEEKFKAEPLYLFISTERENKYAKTLSFFYQTGCILSEDSINASITDIAKTLLNYSKIKYPNYFGGYDLENDDESLSRDY